MSMQGYEQVQGVVQKSAGRCEGSMGAMNKHGGLQTSTGVGTNEQVWEGQRAGWEHIVIAAIIPLQLCPFLAATPAHPLQNSAILSPFTGKMSTQFCSISPMYLNHKYIFSFAIILIKIILYFVLKVEFSLI
jgi:hypothetical protein